jgi:protein-disulfide isomerase
VNKLIWVGACAFMCTLAAATGCNQPKAEKKAESAENTAGSPKACEDLSAQLCKAAGEGGPMCISFKSTIELFTPETCTVALKSVDKSVALLADKRKKCDELQTKLCNDVGKESESCERIKAQTKTFPPERCEMLLASYDDVLKGIRQQEARNKPLSEEKVAALVAGDAPSFGPADAKVTLVEFSDFQCPYCSQAANTVTEIKKKYGDKVRFVFRQFPLSFHQNAHLSAQASLAAHAQGKFWPYHDKLFANQSKLDRESLESYAKELGLDLAKFKKALDDKTYAAKVDAELKLGEESSVGGTPTIFLNGKRVEEPSMEGLSKAIDAALESKG